MISLSSKQNIISFLVGFIFSIGLAFSGMTQPQKIISFLNPFEWDSSLIFVMIAAVGTHLLTYPLVRKRKSPIFSPIWHVPSRNDVSTRLITGSAIFGIGWGLGGYCPGPAVSSLGSGSSQALLFVAAMISGMILFKKTEPYLKLKE